MSLTTSLISYWKLDEASGNALDAHGSNDLTDHNSVGAGTGKINGARDFEAGSSQYASHADTADLRLGDVDFSWAFWVKLESKSSRQVFVKKAIVGEGGSWVEYDNVGDRFVFQINSSSTFGGLTSLTANTLGSPSTGVWYFLTPWHDAAGNQIGMSINDVAETPVSHSGGAIDVGGDFEIGSFASYSLYADGLIDEVGFWKRVLTANERTDLYNDGHGLAYTDFGKPNDPGAELGDASLVSYWPLDEASGNALDAHGSNTLTDNNTVGSATGLISNARDFESGNSEYFSHADNADLSTGDISYTFSAWIKIESFEGNMAIIGKYDSGGEYLLAYVAGTDRLRFYVGGGGTYFKDADSLGGPSTGTWYYVVAWYDADANTVNIQVNNGTVNTLTSVPGPSDTNEEFNIGRIGLSGGIWHFDGLIDEVLFTKKRLTPWERRYLYNSGTGRTYTDFAGGGGGGTPAAPATTTSDYIIIPGGSRPSEWIRR